MGNKVIPFAKRKKNDKDILSICLDFYGIRKEESIKKIQEKVDNIIKKDRSVSLSDFKSIILSQIEVLLHEDTDFVKEEGMNLIFGFYPFSCLLYDEERHIIEEHLFSIYYPILDELNLPLSHETVKQIVNKEILLSRYQILVIEDIFRIHLADLNSNS